MKKQILSVLTGVLTFFLLSILFFFLGQNFNNVNNENVLLIVSLIFSGLISGYLNKRMGLVLGAITGLFISLLPYFFILIFFIIIKIFTGQNVTVNNFVKFNLLQAFVSILLYVVPSAIGGYVGEFLSSKRKNTKAKSKK